MNNSEQNLKRWRLVLGRYASEQIAMPLSDHDTRMETALDYLYCREYEGRGVRIDRDNGGRKGGMGDSVFSLPQWISEIRELFGKKTAETIERHALDRYGITELITDSDTLERLEPNMDLLKLMLTFRSYLQGEVVLVAKRIIGQVVEEIKKRLETKVRRVLLAKRNRFRQSPIKIAQNFDWRRTFRHNLRNYDPSSGKMVIDRLFFHANMQRHTPWHIIICVDQSGSMADSVIYSAVMAGIFTSMPSLRINLVVFDTSIVDLSDRADDPVEVLLSVQLGGGTDIGKALTYCEQLVEIPHRTIVVLVSDFYEGGSPDALYGSCKRMGESGAKLLGLAALDEKGYSAYDKQMAERLADLGMSIGAFTPERLAEWLAEKIS